MSKPTQEQADAAYTALHDATFRPVFVATLKQAGYNLSPAEEQQALALGHELLRRHESNQQQELSKRASLLEIACAEFGIGGTASAADALDASFQKSAAILMGNPKAVEAAATLRDFYEQG